MWLSTLAVYDIFPWVPCCRLCFLYPKGNGSMDCRTLLILNIFTCCQGPQGTSRPCCDDHHSHRSRGFHNGLTSQFGPGTGPGWPTRGDPKLGPRKLLVCSALTWSYMAFVFQFYFWLIFCYFYHHHHSVKLLSMFPKLYLTLCWVPVFLQLLQQFGFFFFFLALRPKTWAWPESCWDFSFWELPHFFAIQCAQTFWIPCLLLRNISARCLSGMQTSSSSYNCIS